MATKSESQIACIYVDNMSSAARLQTEKSAQARPQLEDRNQHQLSSRRTCAFLVRCVMAPIQLHELRKERSSSRKCLSLLNLLCMQCGHSRNLKGALRCRRQSELPPPEGRGFSPRLTSFGFWTSAANVRVIATRPPER